MEENFKERVRQEADREVSLRTSKMEDLVFKYGAIEHLLPEKGYLGNDEFVAAVRLVLKIGAVSVYRGIRKLQKSLVKEIAEIDAACADLGIPTMEELDAAHDVEMGRHRKAG